MSEINGGKQLELTRFYSKVWTIIGPILAYFTFNIWAASQKWNVQLPFGPDFRTIDTYALGIYGILACSFLLIFQVALALRYMKFGRENGFLKRIPPIWNWQLNLDTLEGKLLRCFGFFIFCLFPFTGQVHFTNKFLHGTVFRNNRPIRGIFEDFTMYTAIRESFSGAYRFNGGISYFPFWETWFLVFLQAFILVLVCYYFVKLSIR